MLTRRVLPAFALAGSLLVAGCQNPDGSTDWGSTLALGAGAGLATALIAGAAADDGPRHYHSAPRYHSGYYGRPDYYSRGYSRGYGRGYGR